MSHHAAGLSAFPEDSPSEQAMSPQCSSVAGSSLRGTPSFGAKPKRKQISFDDYHALWKGLATSQPVSRRGNPCESVCSPCMDCGMSVLSCCNWHYPALFLRVHYRLIGSQHQIEPVVFAIICVLQCASCYVQCTYVHDLEVQIIHN